MYAKIDPKQWPGRVVPEDESHVASAVESLCLRAQWHDADRDKITSVVQRWFDRGWCVDAILRAVDLMPDGRLQRRKSEKQDPHSFLKDRLRFWFADEGADSATEPRDPPVQGMTFAMWWAINRRNERINRLRRRKPTLGAEGEQARRFATGYARGLRRDSIANAREKGKRREQALDDLLSEGASPPPLEQSRRRARRKVVNKLVCGWVARQEVIANDPAVLRALHVVLASTNHPTPESVRCLHNAVRAARWKAQMAHLEALVTSAGDKSAPHLSREALRVLRYVDQAVEENLPFNVLVFLLRNDVPLSTNKAAADSREHAS
ncbi:hypothetical protein [Saccharothrix sp.]|uniref:hypothetical protein n=1 Tax=Saccharothrix sp. TaxID=1873460 RepID=UPI002811DACC|nr:hypothetical protein [Saccharothrix sp.]